jgi:hypothetical protein
MEGRKDTARTLSSTNGIFHQSCVYLARREHWQEAIKKGKEVGVNKHCTLYENTECNR